MAVDTAMWRLLGANMRLLRQGAGVSLTRAAELLGYSKSHLCLVERGRDRPSGRLVGGYDDRFAGNGLLRSIYSIARAPGVDDRPAPPAVAPPSDAAGGAVDRSVFVADVTVPDGSTVRCDARLTKVWRIRNGGGVPWIGRRLVRYGPCAGTGIISSGAELPIPDTLPGEEVDLRVEIRAPAVPNTTMAVWKMADAAGRLVFPDLDHGLYVLVTTVLDPAEPLAGAPAARP